VLFVKLVPLSGPFYVDPKLIHSMRCEDHQLLLHFGGNTQRLAFASPAAAETAMLQLCGYSDDRKSPLADPPKPLE
jgi:hypothetical protein